MRNTFLRVLKFLQLKDGGPNFWGELILQNVWITWSPLLYFNLKSFLNPNSMPFISILCILYDSGLLLSGFSNFCKLSKGDLISGGNELFRMSELFGPPLLYFNLKSSVEPNSSSFFSYQSVLHKLGKLFSESWNLYKLKKGDLISLGNQFCSVSGLFGPPFCI